ncbi:hypothetical protein [Endothiovibrio diazotrophicus]
MNVTRKPVRGDLALEMTMRDVMDAMEEQAIIAAYATAAGCVEILSVEPPLAEVHTLPRRHRAEVVPLRAAG